MNRLVFIRLLSLAVLAGVALGAARGFSMARDPRAGARVGEGGSEVAIVVSVVDGDTVRVQTRQGRARPRVRLLGINAPEVAHPGESGECHGRRSTAMLRRILPTGARVRLVADSGQDDTDVYGRLLRYVQVEGVDAGQRQVEAGAAEAMRSWPEARRYGRYVAAQREAAAAGLGLWATCRKR